MRLLHTVPVLALALCVTASSAARAQEEDPVASEASATTTAVPANDPAAPADPAAASDPNAMIEQPTTTSAADPAAPPTTIADPTALDPTAQTATTQPPAGGLADPASEPGGATGTPGIVATDDDPAAPAASGFSCRASAARLTLTGQEAVEPAVANDAGGDCVADLPELVESLSLGELGSVSLLGAGTSTTGGDSEAEADAKVASVVLTPAVGTVIQLDVLTSTTIGRCSGGNAVVEGEARVLAMQTNGAAPVLVPDEDDFTVFEEGGVTLTLNRMIGDGSSRTAQAAVLETSLGEVVIAETTVEAGADACAGAPDDGSQGSGSANGSTGADATTPGSGDESASATNPGFGVNVDLGGQSGHNRLLPGFDSTNPLGGGLGSLGDTGLGSTGLPLGGTGLPLGNTEDLPLGGSTGLPLGNASSLGSSLPSLGQGLPGVSDLPLGGGDDSASEEDDSLIGRLLDFLSLTD